MDRRVFFTGMAALLASTSTVLAEGRVRYNFNNSTSTGTSGSRTRTRRTTARRRYSGKRTVSYRTNEKPGTIIVSTRKRKLYYVLGTERPSSMALVLAAPASPGRVLHGWAARRYGRPGIRRRK
jgi:hypothetical protein